jgi:phosphonate transport system substrate-binding protein
MRRTHRLFPGLLVVALIVPMVLASCAPAKPALGTKENPIVLAFVPSAEAEAVIASAEEFTNLLSEKTGYVFEGTVPTSYAAAIEAMCSGKAQMGTLATFAYILAHQKCGVECALVSSRYGTPYYTGEIIAGVDTGIKTLADLKGKTVCWVDAASTSGYIIPRIMLKAEGVDPDTDLAQQVEAGSHDNVALAVYQGDCDAGAIYVDARDRIEDDYPDVMARTIVIAESPEIPNDGLQFVKDFPPEMKEKIVQAFLEVMETPEGVAAMGKAYGWDAVVEKDDSFYDGFRAILDASGVDVEELAK